MNDADRPSEQEVQEFLDAINDRSPERDFDERVTLTALRFFAEARLVEVMLIPDGETLRDRAQQIVEEHDNR